MAQPADLIVREVIKKVCEELKRPNLSPIAKKYIVKTYNDIPPYTFKNHRATDIIRMLTKFFTENVPKAEEEYKRSQLHPYDQHEWQKQNIGSTATAEQDQYLSSLLDPSQVNDIDISKEVKIQEFLGINDMPSLQYLINPKAAWVYYYVVLDSNYRNKATEDSKNITSFTWNYAGDQNLTGDVATTVGTIRDIVGIRLYQPRVPYVAAMDTDSKRVSVLINELQSQAVITSTGLRYHFLLRPIYEFGQTSIELTTEDYDDGRFYFKQPITTINSFTISFGNPISPITFSTPFDPFLIEIEFVCLSSDK
jgi:hypothetical protein